jgi:hypothetical protein
LQITAAFLSWDNKSGNPYKSCRLVTNGVAGRIPSGRIPKERIPGGWILDDEVPTT